ncbi:AAA family ATPase [Pengzhenrongella sicca]|uniref:AAA family ATPase n=1 Tax=Pengzhenrongella sicca TaxID=2819238 RepID=A0A8A4ZHI2_9MICO|nr:AAA family ATPase [Pengzhenrongella sicca]QTE30851.1 AAA family ATPase [Pengzhenrongella sicca]
MTFAPILRRLDADREHPPEPHEWFLAVPAVAQVLADGWELAQVTVVVGENGAGKSTLVEAIALAVGMGAEGGSTGSRHSTRVTESQLWRHLVLLRDVGAPRRGFFLRAETMHSFYTYLEENPGARPEPAFHQLSHGESFLALATERMRKPGLYLLDEPESALSFTGCLALLAHLHALADAGSQVIVSTHSPLLAGLPGAQIWEVGEWGLRPSAWADLDLVRRWRGFLDDPGRYLHHVLNSP